jgi:hypothetical protein
VSRDAALEKVEEPVLCESRLLGADADLGVVDETGRALLHQAVQPGLLGAAKFKPVVQRSAIWRSLGRPTDGLDGGLQQG